MANVNLIDSSNIKVTQSSNNISLDLGSEVVVDSIRSKNMLNLMNFVSQTINGITFTNNGNGSITINGTATQDFGVNFVLFKIKAGNYYLSMNESSTLPNVFYLYDHDSNVGFGNGAITLSQDYNRMGFDTWIPNGTSFNNITISPQLETGSTATSFAPYQNLTGQEFYSTGEIVIGTWINGKPLYRKVVILGSITVGSVVNQTLESLNITNVSDIFVNVGKSFVKNTSNEIRPLPGAINTSNINYVYCTNTRLYRYCTDNSLNGTWNICLEYTKTTD